LKRHQTIFLTVFFILTNLFIQGQIINNETIGTSKPVILFICEHGAGRSAIAAAFFNKMAKEKNLDFHAIFRGLDPDSAVGPAIQKGLIRDKFDINGWKPVHVSNVDIKNAYRIITLDCILTGIDSTTKPATQWRGIPISQGYEAARDELVNKLQPLILELLKEQDRKN